MLLDAGHHRARAVTGRDLLRGELRGRRGYRAHQLLRDPAAHRELATHGYTVTEPILDAATIDALVAACHGWLERSPHPADGRFHSSYEPVPTDAGAFAQAAIAEHLLPSLAPLVTDEAHLRPSVFQCKPPGGVISGVRCHQDPSLLDEEGAFGLHAWTALTRVRAADGALVVLPGSHRYGTWSRASTLADPFEDLHPTIERHALALELEPGQVIWFDHALIHGSLPNTGSALRLGVSAVAQPRTCETAAVRARDREVRGIADVAVRPAPVELPASAESWPAAVPRSTVELDHMAFGPAALDRTCRVHALLHPGARGVALPSDTSCRP